MSKKKIFIASATKAKEFASGLSEALNLMKDDKDENKWEVYPWFDEKSTLRQTYGTSILTGLIKECGNIDLAIILLTKDDVKIENDEKKLVPRENCIFECGLFMGGLGLEPKRSIIVTSVAKNNFPSDLESIHFINFEEKLISNKETKREEITRVALEIDRHAENNLGAPPKRPVLPVYTPEELVDREKPVADGGDIVAKTKLGVVVNTVQPVETKVSLARRVVENMDAGIEYYYFFRAEQLRMPAVAELLQALVLAKLGASDTLTEEERVSMIEDRADDVVKALKKIQKKLFIHLLPKERIPLYFCVHNALVSEKARCYLRYPGKSDYFIPWASHNDAYAVAEDLLKLRGRKRAACIFYPTEYFDIYASKDEEMDMKENIEDELREQFSDKVYNMISKYCFV